MEEIIRNEWQSLRMNVNSKVFKINRHNQQRSQSNIVSLLLPTMYYPWQNCKRIYSVKLCRKLKKMYCTSRKTLLPDNVQIMYCTSRKTLFSETYKGSSTINLRGLLSTRYNKKSHKSLKKRTK